MYRMYYMPEGSDLDGEHLAKAHEHHCVQVVIGKSDIINNFVEDFDKVQVVSIPEVHEIFLNGHAFEEGQEIEAIYVNEWKLMEPFEKCKFVVKMIDPDNPKNFTAVAEYDPEYDGQFRFTQKFKVDSYGEYFIEVYVDDQFTGEVDFIIYKPSQEEPDSGPRFSL